MIKPSEHRPTQAVIHLAKLKHNIEWMIQKLEPEQKLYAVVKADAYGHGAVPIAQAAIKYGAKGILVATVDEAIEIRKGGIEDVPVMVMGLTEPKGIAEILLYNITITIAHKDFFEKAYNQLEQTNNLQLLEDNHLTYHVALDTGMGRIGLTSKEDIEAFAETASQYSWAHWEGVFTHFATAGGGDPEYITFQKENWLDLVQAVPETVIERHYANSGMGLWHQEAPFSTIVRYGISMYGYDPKDQLPKEFHDKYHLENGLPINQEDPLEPIMELVTELINVKEVPKGTHVSYGARYVAESDEWIGTIPIGYADGWHRRYQTFDVLIDGQRCPVAGVINMDQMMVRLPKYYPEGTLVTLLGRNGDEYNHASVLATQVNTIAYEVLTSIGKRVQRVYIEE